MATVNYMGFPTDQNFIVVNALPYYNPCVKCHNNLPMIQKQLQSKIECVFDETND